MRQLSVPFRLLSAVALPAVLLALAAVADSQPPQPGVIATFKGHTDAVYSVAFSPDSKYLVTGSFDHSIKLWDLATGKEVKTYSGPAGHQKQVLTVAFSPDGHLMATGGADNTLKIWDVPTTSPLRILDQNDAVNGLALSPDGTKLAAAGKDGVVGVFGTADGKRLFELKGHAGPVNGVAFSVNNQILASAGADATVRFWNATNGQPLGTIGAHAGPASAVAINPNNTTAYSAGADGTLKFLQLPVPPARPLPAHGDAVSAVALSNDGNLVFSAGADKVVRIGQFANAKEVRTLTGAPAAVTTVAVNGNASLAAAGSADGHLLLWNAGDGKPAGQAVAHAGAVTGVSFHPGNTQLLTSGADGLLKIWAMPPVPTRALAHPDSVLAAAVTSDGKRLFTAGADKVVRTWDLVKGAVERQYPGHPGPVAAVAVSPNGQILVSGGTGGVVRFWNQASGKEAENLGAHEKKVTGLAINAANNQLVSTSEDGTVKLWQLPVAAPKLFAHPDVVTSAAVSPDGAKLLTGSGDKQVHLWNLATGARERTFTGPTLPVTSVALSLDGKTVAAGSKDKTVHLWNAADGKPLHRLTLPAAVEVVALSPDGKHVSAGLADGSVRVHDVQPPKDKGKEKEVRSLPAGKGGVTALLYTPKGDLLFARGDEVQIWTAAGATPAGAKPFGPIATLAANKDATRYAAASGKVVKIWGAPKGEEVVSITTPGDVRAIAFAPDSNRVVLGGADGRTRVYGLDGKLHEFFASGGPVRAVAFHPDGKRVLAASDDKMARAWTGALVWQRAHGGPVREALFTPKSDQVVAAGDKVVKVWNAPDGKEVKSLSAHDGAIADLAVSADGSRLVTAGADRQAKVWSLAPTKPGTKDDGKPLVVFAVGAPVQSVTISPNGLRVAAAAGDKNAVVRVFDVALGREILAIPEPKGTVTALTFLGDNRTLIAAGTDKTARVLDVGVLGVLDAHKGGVVGVQYHANGTQALTAGKDNTVKLWDLAKGTVLKEFGKPGEPVAAVTFNRDSTQVGVAAGKTVRVFNVADGKELLALPHPADVLSLSFSADKARIATGAADKRTRLWDMASGKELQFFAQPDAVRAVVLHPNNQDAISGAGKAVTVEGATVVRVVAVSPGPVHALTLTPNNTHVLTAGADKVVTFWNANNGAKERTVAGAGDALHAVAVSKNLALLATGGADRTVRLYTFGDGKEVKAVQAPGSVHGLAFTPNNTALAAACADKSLVVWNTTFNPGQPPPETFLRPLQTFAHTAGATDVVFANDNATLYSAGLDRAVKAWKVAADTPVRNLPHPNIVDTVAFHPTAPLLASGGHDGKVRFFDLVKGAQVREIKAHPKQNETMVYAVAFSPDGKHLASAGYDHTIKLWDAGTGALVREFKTIPLRPSPQVAARLVGVLGSPRREGSLVAPGSLLAGLDRKAFDKGHEEAIFSLAFSPDGKHLATGSGGLERAIKLWNVADATLVRDLHNPKLKVPPGVAQAHPGWVYGLRFTSDGKRLVSVGDAPLSRGYLAVWDPAEGKLVHGEELSLGVFYSVAVAPDGRTLAIGAGPRGRPTPEFNSAYLLKMPDAAGT
ncbi:MAG: hypothetical protein IT429_12030 [Gemmataceae bacterium]|nr:hypothetical protein [Gemmataceae bacterium]